MGAFVEGCTGPIGIFDSGLVFGIDMEFCRCCHIAWKRCADTSADCNCVQDIEDSGFHIISGLSFILSTLSTPIIAVEISFFAS